MKTNKDKQAFIDIDKYDYLLSLFLMLAGASGVWTPAGAPGFSFLRTAASSGLLLG